MNIISWKCTSQHYELSDTAYAWMSPSYFGIGAIIKLSNYQEVALYYAAVNRPTHN